MLERSLNLGRVHLIDGVGAFIGLISGVWQVSVGVGQLLGRKISREYINTNNLRS